MQVVGARTLMSEDLSAWRCQAAPRAEEIVWGNLGFRIWERSGGWAPCRVLAGGCGCPPGCGMHPALAGAPMLRLT